MAMDRILPFLSKFNTRLTWLSLFFLIFLISSFAHLNFNYRPLSPAQKSDSVSYYHPGDHLALANELTHSSKFNELAKAPVKIYLPPQGHSSDLLVDVWDSLSHKAQAAAKGSHPKDKDAYYKALHCPVCPDSKSPTAKAEATPSKCPDFKQMLKNVAAEECKKCPFDASRCPHPPGTNVGATSSASSRPLISYLYHESPSSRANLRFFVNHALHDAADFVFILQGNTTAEDDVLPKGRVNVNVYKNAKTPSPCHPLAPHFEIISGSGGGPRLKDVYKRFILMDSELRGPFIPRWSSSCWSDAITRLVTDRTKLVGTQLSCMKGKRPHLHHHLLATDKEGLAALMEIESLSLSPDSTHAPNPFCDTSQQLEAEEFLTDTIRGRTWETAVLDMSFKDASQYRYFKCVKNSKTFAGPDNKDTDVDPWEVLFVDAGANATAAEGGKRLESLSKKVKVIDYSSFDACRR